MNSKRKFNWLRIVILSSAVITVLATVIYLIKFHSGLSNQSNDWGNFGDYFNLFVSVGNFLLVFSLTFIIYKVDQKYKAIAERPIIIVQEKPGSNQWSIKNVGKGPAINIVVGLSKNSPSIWTQAVKCYSLASGDTLELPWLKNASEIAVSYFDVLEENVYSSICSGDETNIVVKDVITNLRKTAERLPVAYENAKNGKFSW